MTSRDPYIYLICRVDNKTFHTINDDLKKRGYTDIRSIVPTLEVIRKTKNNQNHVELVPLLFNYGFLRIKRSYIFNKAYMTKLRNDIPGLHSWVKSLESLHKKRIKTRIDNNDDFDDYSRLATIPKPEIRRLKAISKRNHIYSNEDILGLVPGTYLTLKGYPYEGLGATIVDINLNTQEVKVQLLPTRGISIIILSLPLENVMYTVYTNHDAETITAPDYEVDLSCIPDSSTSNY